ncbi:MAG: Lipid A export ATP-binding/permease protein MsbA [Ignavibacteriae bacterium]|nr:MAG: Lipid A export ATP-binding/permease protein MsbA [Ignavibacteriota bacterium]
MKSLLRLIPYLRRYKKPLYIGLIAIIGSNIFTAVQPHFVGKAIDDLKYGLEAHALNSFSLLYYALIIVGFTLIAGIMSFITRQTIIVTSRKIEYDLRNDFLAHLQKLHYSFFQNTPTGDLMAHATNDISAVRNVLGPGIMYPADTIVTFIMVLTMMILKNWQLTLIALIPLPLVSFAVYKLGKLINIKFQDRQEQFSKLTARAQENLSGIRIIKAYVREDYEIQTFRNLSWDYLKKNLVLARYQSIIWPTMFLLVGISLVLTIYFGGVSVIENKMSIGTLTAFFAYLMMLIWPMIAFGWVTNILQQGAASMKRISKILDTIPEIRNSENVDYSIKSINGDIEFQAVTFKYNDTQTPVLKNINLKIPAGKTLAIVGYTGSGKSTLVSLVPRLYDVSEGKILIDGRDIKTIPLEILRANIGFVPQETFLFSDSIANNIAYGVNDADIQKIIYSSDTAQLSKDVNEFPKNFDTVIGERGITLSGGQKQRVSIARAIIRDPKILILDDALSSVDTYTEEAILKKLKEIMKNRTSIIISHRISTVKDADLIIVLHNGQIVEQGTHEELLESGKIYKDLYNKQLLEEELEKL